MRLRRLVVPALLALLSACGSGSSTISLDPPTGTPLRDLTQGRILVGTAVAIGPLRNDAAYAARIAEQYDVLVPENAMKFDQVETSKGHFFWDDADFIVDFAEAHGMTVRGHALVWHQQSDWASRAPKADLPGILQNHIAEEVGRYKGRVAHWDVVNEAISDDGAGGKTLSQALRQTFWLEAWKQVYPGKPDYQYIEDAFTWAHEADPDAKLFYNEYGDEGWNAWGDPNNHKAEYTRMLVKQLVDDGVPIHGVGLQMHVGPGPWPYPLNADFAKQVKYFRDLGLEVHITELDQRLPLPVTQASLDAQGQFYEDLLGASLDAGVGAFLTWGLDDGHSWIPGFYRGYGAGLPFDAEYNAKPAFYGMQRALEATR
jgi:endo-1,4-beta-xylanase